MAAAYPKEMPFCSCDQLFFANFLFPDPDLPADLPGCAWSIPGYNLDVNAGIQTFRHRTGNILPDRIGDGCDAYELQVGDFHFPVNNSFAVILNDLVGKPQRSLA